MIKKIILFLLIMLITSCSTLIKEGEYCQFIKGEYISPCIQFKRNKMFNWKISGHVGPPTIGKGIYEIKNKNLYLKFRKDSVVYNSSFEILNSEKTSEDNISLKIKVENEQRHPVPGVSITLNKVNSKKYSSNLKGIEIINNLPKSKDEIKIGISALGYKDYSFEYTPNKNAELLITINKLKSQVISDTTFIYKIIKKRYKKLILENSMGQSLNFKNVGE